MEQYIALLRGINVGGHNRLPMKELAAALDGLGLKNIKTYIQSGNVVFQAEADAPERLASQIGKTIEQSHGFLPQVMVLGVDAWQTAVSQNPFPEAEPEPKTLHLFFLQEAPANPDLEQLNAIKKESERFQLIDTVFYLHAPDGIGRSKLAERAERLLGVPATARNWRTVIKISEIINM
jgi:uncharacterized protein (DUF1697 family)